MLVHTRISAALATHESHHPECEREHDIITISFTATTESGGRSETDVEDCLLFEIEDAAQYTLAEAWESDDDAIFWTVDDGDVRDAAVPLAAMADRLSDGEVTAVAQEIRAV